MISRISASLFRNTETVSAEEASPLTETTAEPDAATSNEDGGGARTYGSVSNHRDPSSASSSSSSSSSATTEQAYEELGWEILAAVEEENGDEDDDLERNETDGDDEVDDALTSLTRRLRCLFSVVTWPIVPLGSICILALIWLLYASFVLDINKSCSYPLHWYSIISMLFLIYLPFHTSIRSYFFHYDRDRDGPNRPASVRRYDQCFNTIALLYVYAGITLVQTCRNDVILPDGAADAPPNTLDMASLNNTCTATCPNTFVSLRVYVACLEIFVLSLIVPLLFLPCLYLYFVRRTMQDAEALSILQDRLREEEAVRRNGGITANTIMEYFEKVQLVVDPRSTERKVLIIPHPSPDNKEDSGSETSISSIDYEKAKECDTKECCICMKNFKIKDSNDLEKGEKGEDDSDDRIVRTSQTCNHLFHYRCIASWVGGRWDSSGNAEQRQARHTTCPLCRRDFRPNR